MGKQRTADFWAILCPKIRRSLTIYINETNHHLVVAQRVKSGPARLLLYIFIGLSPLVTG